MIHFLRQKIVHRIAESHLAGPNFSDVEPLYRQALERGWASAIGPWTNPANTAKETANIYLSDVKTIIETGMKCYYSIKLTTVDYDYPFVKDLLDLAKSKDIRIHFDGMDPESAVPSYKLIEKILATHRNIGCTLPSRWKRSIKDAQRVIDYELPVRVIKGQWTDPGAPSLDCRKNFLAIIDVLAGRARHVAVATHDRRLAAKAFKLLKDANSSFEMEQMSSLPQNCAGLAKSLNIPMRIYIPYGFPSLPYNLRHVKTRPAIAAWIIRDFILGGRKTLSSAR